MTESRNRLDGGSAQPRQNVTVDHSILTMPHDHLDIGQLSRVGFISPRSPKSHGLHRPPVSKVGKFRLGQEDGRYTITFEGRGTATTSDFGGKRSDDSFSTSMTILAG